MSVADSIETGFDHMVKQFYESSNFLTLEPSTQDFYQSALKTILEIYQQMAPASSICEWIKVFELIGNTLNERGVSGASIQQYFTVMKLVFRWAGKPVAYTYRISANERKAHKRKRINRWFTEQDIEACLHYRFGCNHERNQLMVRILVETGARVRELWGAAWGLAKRTC